MSVYNVISSMNNHIGSLEIEISFLKSEIEEKSDLLSNLSKINRM